MLNRQLKEIVDKTCDMIELVGTHGGLDEGIGEASKIEIGMFMMYLSASDGTIQWDEASIISDICDLNLSPSNLGDFIRDKNIYSTEFESKVPVTFKLMVTADNELRKAGVDVTGSDLLLETYKAVGEALVKADGDVDENEVSDYKIYINMLERYRDENLNGGSGVSGFKKNNNSSVSAPSKSGVAAPRKG